MLAYFSDSYPLQNNGVKLMHQPASKTHSGEKNLPKRDSISQWQMTRSDKGGIITMLKHKMDLNSAVYSYVTLYVCYSVSHLSSTSVPEGKQPM